MTSDIVTGDALTKEVVRYLHKGKNFVQIADSMQLSVEEVEAVWTRYVNDRKQMPADQQFILHLERLEDLLTLAHDNMEMEMDSDGLEVTLKILDRIEDLQATALSRKTAAEDSLQILSNMQVDLFYRMLSTIEGMYRMTVEEAFKDNDVEYAKKKLLGDFSTTFGQITQQAYVEEVEPYEV